MVSDIMAEQDEIYVDIPLSGKLRTGKIHSTQLSEGDFQILTNMRYHGIFVQSIHGMDNVNTTAIIIPS